MASNRYYIVFPGDKYFSRRSSEGVVSTSNINLAADYKSFDYCQQVASEVGGKVIGVGDDYEFFEVDSQ